MDKFLKIFDLLLKLWSVFFPPKKKIVNTEDENIQVMKVALDSVEQTDEVIRTKKKIDYIETLSKKEREKKQEEIKDIQSFVEKKAAAKPITEDRAKDLISRAKNRRNS